MLVVTNVCLIVTLWLIKKMMMLMVKTYLKKKQFVEFVWLTCVKGGKLSRWNAAAKVNLLWPTKSVL